MINLLRSLRLWIKAIPFLTCLAWSGSSTYAAVEHYVIDPSHSSITFKVRHFFSQIPGNLTQFSGNIYFDPERPEKSSVETVIQAASVDTRHEKRDTHLRNEDFLHSDEYPQIIFRSTAWKAISDKHFSITGDLTILDTTLPVTLDAHLLGRGQGFDEATYLSGWSATATLSRSAFGITYAKPAVGDEVAVEIAVEAKRISSSTGK